MALHLHSKHQTHISLHPGNLDRASRTGSSVLLVKITSYKASSLGQRAIPLLIVFYPVYKNPKISLDQIPA